MRQATPCSSSSASYRCNGAPGNDSGVGPVCSGMETPEQWSRSLSAPADLTSDRAHWPSALLRHWTGTSPDMDQPPLDHHYIVQHLGGAKHVQRRLDGKSITTRVESGTLTMVPAGTRFLWHTCGPIEFAHLYVSPALLQATAMRCKRGVEVSLVDRVGQHDPLLQTLFGRMLAELRTPCAAHTLYMDSLLETFMLTLVMEHTTGSTSTRPIPGRETLTAYTLRRVVEFVEANLHLEIALADLVEVAGGSAFHFSRAFKNSSGQSPYQFVIRRRIERARKMLTRTNSGLELIAAQCGFRDPMHLARLFTRAVGLAPSAYRRAHR